MKDKELSKISSDDYFFEGTEKLLEIWFYSKYENTNLRNIPRDKIISILDEVNCQIVSEMKNDYIDSYVLSESSLFISQRRIILKTCGTTYLLKALQPILTEAKYLGFLDYQIFYSRRRFEYPDSQPPIHQDFNREITHFNKSINAIGAAYIFGRLNEEYWNLYVTDKPKSLNINDQTFEVIMSDLDPDKMKVFYQANNVDATDATKKSGIVQLFPGAAIDDFLFDPCGYSMNGLIYEDKYFTIHITPEKGFSYASFETNYPDNDYVAMLQKLLDIFGPSKFFFTLISDEDSHVSRSHNNLSKILRLRNGYMRKDWQRSIISDLDVTFAYFVRNPG